MGKTEYRMICCDLDGTLLDDRKQVSEKNKEMIQHCRSLGMKFAIASGRPLEPVLQLMDIWGITELVDYVIGMNGGIVYDCETKQKQEYHLLSGDVIREVIHHFQGMKVRFAIFDGAIRYVSYSNEETAEKAKEYCEIEQQIDMDTLCNQPRNKLIIQCEPAYMPLVEEHAKTYHNNACASFKTAADLFEYVDPFVHKSFGIQRLCEHIGITMQEVIAFGDTSNDNEMLRDAGLGVWMCNGTKDTKAMADTYTIDNNQSGVGYFLSKHLL